MSTVIEGNIVIKEVSKEQLTDYARIPSWLEVTSEFRLKKVDGGLGGILFDEVVVEPYIKDLDQDDNALTWNEEFDITNWGFFIAYHSNKPIGGACLAFKTKDVHMLSDREDLAVLWDIRVAPEYKGMGIGKKLISLAIEWSRERNCKQLKIECQNNNVPACRFYAKQGAILGEINQYAYYGEYDNEVQLIWYINLDNPNY